MGKDKNLGMQETVATLVAAAIILTLIVYWIVQIDGVMEMLDLANG